MLGTIKVPKNLAQLTKNLPRSNYISTRESKFTSVSHSIRLPSEPALLNSGSRLLPQINSMKDIRNGYAPNNNYGNNNNETMSGVSDDIVNNNDYKRSRPKPLAMSIEDGIKEVQMLKRRGLDVI